MSATVVASLRHSFSASDLLAPVLNHRPSHSLRQRQRALGRRVPPIARDFGRPGHKSAQTSTSASGPEPRGDLNARERYGRC